MEFIDISEWMTKSREERRSHLKLNEKCIEIGGDSRIFRGLLAHTLKTTIPHSKNQKCRILVCHGCNNPKCSNPYHLYWGTDSDNRKDYEFFNPNFKSLKERTIEKYGLEEYKRMNKEAALKGVASRKQKNDIP